MFAVAEMPTMARKPKQDVNEKPTTHVRVMPDLAEMIGWIVRVEKRANRGGSAQLLDPMLRPQITARYKKYLPHIQKLQAMEAELEKAEEEAAAAIKKPPRMSEG